MSSAMKEELEVLRAFQKAMERRTEVVELLGEAPSPGEAQRLLADALDISEAIAAMVLSMELRRLIPSERANISRAIAELEAQL